MEITKRYYWTDSTITLCWIKGDSSNWKIFVANRVTEITSITDPDNWNYVKTDENPADIISRGKFDSTGIATGCLDDSIGKVQGLRLNVHSESDNWAILSEIHIQEKVTVR